MIGWSTHEPPADTAQVMIAAALGAQMFERHVGLETDTIKLNAYSSTPEQVDAWIRCLAEGADSHRLRARGEPLAVERTSIDELQARRVRPHHDRGRRELIRRDQIYFAFPVSARTALVRRVEGRARLQGGDSRRMRLLLAAASACQRTRTPRSSRARSTRSRRCSPMRACRSATSSPRSIRTTTASTISARSAPC